MAKVFQWLEVQSMFVAVSSAVYFELVCEGFLFVGPLISFTQEGDSVAFKLQWCAMREGCDPNSRWRIYLGTDFTYDKKESVPAEKEPGRIYFSTETGGVSIYLNGRKVVDPAQVEGLDPRFLQHQG